MKGIVTTMSGFYQTDHSGDWSPQQLLQSRGTLVAMLMVIATAAFLWWRSWAYPSASVRHHRFRSDAERFRLRDQLVAAVTARRRLRAATKNPNDRSNTTTTGTATRTRRRQVWHDEESSSIDTAAPAAAVSGPAEERGGGPIDNKKKSNGPRQANLSEQMRYREERASLEQFGFSIYGNAEYCVDCVPASKATSSFASTSRFGLGIHQVAAIPHLPGATQVYKELERLRVEFEPIVQARGWKVLTLSELCCCGDGGQESRQLLFPAGHTESSSSRQPQRHGGDETIMGYCVGSNDNRLAVGIHIRCRIPGSCTDGLRLFPYAELVRTMVRFIICNMFLTWKLNGFYFYFQINNNHNIKTVSRTSAHSGGGPQ
jgi:hypothetical protein